MNPLDLIARKQRVGQADAELIMLPVMAYLDAAKRSACTATGANFFPIKEWQ